jgi:hypothetical protein
MWGRVAVPFLVLALLLIWVAPGPSFAQTAPQDYTALYNSGALYTYQGLHYQFSGLDSSVEYTWKVERLSANGSPAATVATWSVGPGVTTASRSVSFWPESARGPMRVVDHWGQVVGRHFVADIAHDDWFDTQTVDANEKVGIGDVIYNAVNGDGYQHDEDDPETVTVAYGDYVLLHYRTSSAGTTDVVRLVDVDGGATMYEFPISDLYDFNGGGHSNEDLFRFWSYVVLTTNGTPPEWVDGDLSAATFSGDNPHNAVLPPGAYEYARLTSGGVLVDVGESLLLVSNDSQASEWLVRVDQKLAPGDTQHVRLRAATEAVWDALDLRQIYDSFLAGGPEAVTDAWSISRQDDYLAGSPAANLTVTTSWCFSAGSLTWATPLERRLCSAADYLIHQERGLESRLDNVLQPWNLANDMGHFFVFLLGVVASGFAARKFLNLGRTGFILSYLALSVAALLSGWLTGWLALVIGLSLLLVVILLVLGVRGD